jgi:CRP-like cAMP-binding protein
MDLDQKLQALGSSGIFRNLTHAELEDLLKFCEEQSFHPDSNLVIEGEQSSGLYVLVEGMASVRKTDKTHGDSFEVTRLREGESFGEMSLLSDQPRAATIYTLSPTKVLYLSRASFERFLQAHPTLQTGIHLQTIRELMKRLREIDQKYTEAQRQLWRFATTGEHSDEKRKVA